jgi:spore coat polysaccharide biosynthesis protein SpsF
MKGRKIVATIESRMGSSRLPGKSMADIMGKPLLGRIVERLKNSRFVDEICVATTLDRKDDVIADYAEKLGVRCFRGSEEDVLGRVVGAAEAAGADIISEVTGDMAVADWETIDRGIEVYLGEPGWDIVTNSRTPGFPLGVDVQVYSLGLLRRVSQETSAPDDREHVTLYIYKHPEKFKIYHLNPRPEHYDPSLRLMVDFKEDLQLMREIYSRLYPKNSNFTLTDVLELLRKEPKLRQIVDGIG